jgi:excisionase family DNA binding protein
MAVLLKVTEAARELNVSRAKAWEWVRDGRLPSVKIDGILRIRQTDLDAFVEGLPIRDVTLSKQ